MLSAHELNGTSDVSNVSFADMDEGTDASWISSAWGPSYIAADVKKTPGDWRAAADTAVDGRGRRRRELGRLLVTPVFSTSKVPAQPRLTFSEWMNGDHAGVEHHQDARHHRCSRPTSRYSTAPSFTNITVPVSGTSAPLRRLRGRG